MMRFAWCALACLLLAAPVAAADDDVWKLVFEDDFERAEIGDDWICPDSVSIRNGRFWIVGPGTVRVQIARSFKPDVKLAFEAEANPDLPPCDIAVTMAGGHLLQFGGGNNTFNAIRGGGATARDNHPEKLIEPGRRYQCVVIKEGPRVAYYVDGELLIEATTEDPLGGPGFDQVGLITWHGMIVDNVKVYERTTPAPGGPVIITNMPQIPFTWDNRELTYTGSKPLPGAVSSAIKLYNQRRYQDAFDAIVSMNKPTFEGVVTLAFIVADVGFEDTPAHQAKLAELAHAVSHATPEDTNLQRFRVLCDWFKRINVRSRDHIATQRLLRIGMSRNPFYYKALLYETRYNYAHAIEGARRDDMAKARATFAELKKIWPEHRALREWTGEQIPWGEELIHDESDGPAWARYLQEALARQMAVLEWWFTVRQAPDGSLGGGWGDDVEILRGWVPIACISTACEPAVAGIERLAEGVWDNVLEKGYDRGAGDVEHSAEPSADSLPTMILLRYGDPLWVERNLRSAKTIREMFMDINQRGQLQFMSGEFGVERVNRGLGSGGDTGYHARAMKHFIWLAWYGIPEAREIYLQWCEMWRELTMREIGTKPVGYIPATVWFPSGDIACPDGRPWYDPRANYYGFPGLPGMIHDAWLTAYLLDPDEKWLDPIRTMMTMSTMGPLRKGNPDLPPDHMQNLVSHMAHQSSPNVTAVYRWLTGERVYDEYTLRFGKPTQQYRVTYDLDAYAETFEKTAKALRTNWTQRTSEVLQTDRAGLAGSQEVFGAYTGAVRDFRDGGAPTISVTYDTPNLNFAAVVTETTPRRLRLRIYNFNDEPMRVGLRPWRLEPGVYVLTTGTPVEGEYDFQNRYTWSDPIEVAHNCPGTPYTIDVPSHVEWVVDLRVRQLFDRPAELPDLAIHSRDVKQEGDQIRVAVHNIGSAAATKFPVTLETFDGEFWTRLDRVELDGLPAIEKLEPVRREITLTLPGDAPANRPLRVRVDPLDDVPEHYEHNNTVVREP